MTSGKPPRQRRVAQAQSSERASETQDQYGAQMPGPTATPRPAEGHVFVLRWPDDASWRETATARGDACLLLVAEGAEPPAGWGPLEDWLREPASAEELASRKASLGRRWAAEQPVHLDEDGLLRRGDAWIALAPLELRLLDLLLPRRDEIVSRDEAHAALYDGGPARPARLIDATVRRLRRRVAPLGLTIHTIRATGFLLEVGEPPSVRSKSESAR